MQKIRYELDPHNRLVIDTSGEKSDLPKFRRVLDGQFRTDENNNLSYHVKAPLPEDDAVPHQIKLTGEWSLTDDHKLRLTLDKSARETFGDQITFQGEILDVNEDSLLFAVTTTTKEDTQSTYVLNLAGSWKADDNNRLSFYVRREEGRHDILAFNGAWEVNKNHQIIYRYEKARLVRKKRLSHTLMFKGHWDIKNAGRISYILSKGTDSVFDFQVSGAVFKEDYVKYEVGIGLSGRARPATRVVTLYGRWNIKRDVGLIFEIEYGDGNRHAIVFGADARLTDRDTVSFSLRDETENKDIGVNLEINRRALKGDGEAFMRFLASRRELAVYAGAAWDW